MKRKILLVLVTLAVMDLVIPVPIAVLLLIYVLVRKPDWFREFVRQVYDAP